MDIDTIVLKFEAVFDKMKTDLGNTIEKWKQLDNATSGVANTFDKMANNVDSAMNKMSKSIDSSGAKQKLEDLKKQLNFQISDYNKNLKAYQQWGMVASTKTPESTVGMSANEIREAFGEPITPQTLIEQKSRINELRANIEELKNSIRNMPQARIIPNTSDASRNLKEVGNEASNTGTKLNRLSNNTKGLNSNFNRIGKTLSSIGKSFSKITDNISKGVDKNFRNLKKLTLGLVGVRTAMALLTRGVNAYLSFDSELQESINNSWNMLGSLLAPAIELVANLFALATNYIAQFVSTLTGIDLVARANAKALNSQATATKNVGDAQRGLLAMDEITNLPTEPGGGAGGIAKQIKAIDIKPIKFIDEFLTHIKKREWHLAGEDIAHAINKGMDAINWENIKPKANKLGENIASFLNGLFEVNWYDIGRTLGEGVNTAIEFADGFINEFSVIQFLGGIGKAINKFIETIDWKKASETLSTYIVKLFDGIQVFLEIVDWEKVGTTIVDFLADIDWFSIAMSNTKLQLSLLKAIAGLAIGVIERLPSWIEKNFERVMEYLGRIGGKSFANAIIAGINALVNSINVIINPIGNMIKAIASISGKKVSPIFGIPNIPYLETGTNEIEYEGLYHLHEGEAVVPKRYNPSTGGYDNSADNKKIIDLLISLNSSMLEYAERPIDINIGSRRIAEAIYDDTKQIDRTRNVSSVVVRS